MQFPVHMTLFLFLCHVCTCCLPHFPDSGIEETDENGTDGSTSNGNTDRTSNTGSSSSTLLTNAQYQELLQRIEQLAREQRARQTSSQSGGGQTNAGGSGGATSGTNTGGGGSATSGTGNGLNGTSISIACNQPAYTSSSRTSWALKRRMESAFNEILRQPWAPFVLNDRRINACSRKIYCGLGQCSTANSQAERALRAVCHAQCMNRGCTGLIVDCEITDFLKFTCHCDRAIGHTECARVNVELNAAGLLDLQFPWNVYCPQDVQVIGDGIHSHHNRPWK